MSPEQLDSTMGSPTTLSLAQPPAAAPARVLVVDDDPRILRMMRRALEIEGYVVELAPDGDTALDLLRSRGADVVILDLMLPGRDGLEICRTIRQESAVPVLMLTARDEARQKVAGLDSGADDYVVKPFDMVELLARLRALLRRAQPREMEILRFEDIELIPMTREVHRGGERLELTNREYELLEFFLQHPRQVLSREQILQHVWGYDYMGDSNLVDVRIKYLRDKLEAGDRPRLIQTLRGAGYALRTV